MKIGIMTFWWSEDNYGQLLQCYALQKYLRDQGHDPFLIRYDPRGDYSSSFKRKRKLNILNPKKVIKFLFKKALMFLSHEKCNRQFSQFRESYINSSDKIYYSYEELCQEPPQADCYIVGSDQVWNFYNMKLSDCRNLVHAYFLDFGKESIKRIAYAASWGKVDISKEFVEEISLLLAKFDYVSVREKTGIDICRKCGASNAEVCFDPTLLISAEQYRLLYRTESIIKHAKKYILIYRLGNPCDFPMRSLYKWATEKGLDVVYVTANGWYDSYEKIFPTITQWLALVDHAEYVITNSFHCCVFSIIFRKQFGVIPLIKSHSGMNSRIETLFDLFEITPRWIEDNNLSVLEKTVEYSIYDRDKFDKLSTIDCMKEI